MTSPLLEPLPVFPIRVLLVDDQRLVAEAVKRILQEEIDITLFHCSEGNKAISMASELKPTVILQDIIMPDANGLQLIENYRSNENTKDIPIIMLSSREEPEIKADAFRMGGNDYVVKLPDKLELIARIRYHSENYIRLLERNAAYKRIEASEKIMRNDIAEAATYVESLLPLPISHGVKVDWKFIPSARLGGDSFGYKWIDDTHFAIYLLDVSGHGVGAALLSVSALNFINNLENILRLDPKKVLEELNSTFPMENHNNMFFSIWYGVFDSKNNTLLYSNGGHPPPILLRNNKIQELSTDGTVIGIDENTKFHQQSIDLFKDDRIYLFTDGTFELSRADGKMFSYHEFIKLLENTSPTKSLDSIVELAYEWQGSRTFADDYSLIRMEIK